MYVADMEAVTAVMEPEDASGDAKQHQTIERITAYHTRLHNAFYYTT